MSKRKVSFDEDVESPRTKKTKEVENVKKHSLDSDEEDDDNNDVYNVLNEDDIEGEEDGVAGNEDGIRTTAFNMREEMEEGYFDKDGHFLWNKDKEIRDNWLDNIDWQQIKPQDKNAKNKNLGDDSDSDDDIDPNAKSFNEIDNYKQILTYMEPKENITKSLRRLGGANKKLSSVERLKLKKAGLLNLNNDKVIKLTELANEILNQTGNMDIYQETYEHISSKIGKHENKNKKPKEQELDMYADDFDVKEKKRLDDPGPSTEMDTSNEENTTTPVLMWEFKWKIDSDKIEGPTTTEQMQKYVDEGKFKDGVWVRKTGQDQFYSSSRIDFELYLS